MGFNMFQVEPRERRRLNTLLAQFTTLFFRKAVSFLLLAAPNHSLAHLSTNLWLKLAFKKMCLDEECILDYESHYNLILCTKNINTTWEFSITSVKHLE